jgi:hypothetical protein
LGRLAGFPDCHVEYFGSFLTPAELPQGNSLCDSDIDAKSFGADGTARPARIPGDYACLPITRRRPPRRKCFIVRFDCLVELVQTPFDSRSLEGNPRSRLAADARAIDALDR